MFRKAFVAFLLISAPFAFAVEDGVNESGQSRVKLSDAEAAPASREKAYTLDFKMELRAQRDLRDRPQTRARQGVHEVSLGGSYRFDREASVVLELSAEELNQQSTFFAKQALIDWTFWPQYMRLRLGQQFLPVGLINERDNWFSSNPPFMQKIFAASKGIDLGAILDVYPLGNSWVYLEGGTFSGRFVREEDARTASPEQAPRLVSLKSHSEFHDAFATYFEHDLAFFDPLRAWGTGFELRAPEWYGLKPSLLTEYWSFRQVQRVGPDELNRALLIYGQLEWWRLKAGYRWSESTGRLQSAVGSEALPLEHSRLLSLDVRLLQGFKLRGERVLETQSEVLRDEWVARALVDFSL